MIQKKKREGVTLRKASGSGSPSKSSPKTAPGFPSDPSREETLRTEVEVLERKLASARKNLDRATGRVMLPKMRAELTGTCWRYRNQYGGGRRSFWTYMVIEKVVDVWNGSARFKSFTFDIDDSGKVSFDREGCSTLFDGWTRVTPTQREKAFTAACSAAGAMYAKAIAGGTPQPKARSKAGKRGARLGHSPNQTT